MLNIGCKSVKSVFKIQLKAFKDNAKNQKNHKIFKKMTKKKNALCYNTLNTFQCKCILNV
ncbi:hypothetical protein [Helicobacter pylori]|uniref:hypothetical protein n=1 Tax=Helicobacter pylori TaxID=210 RepID=UPI00046D5309